MGVTVGNVTSSKNKVPSGYFDNQIVTENPIELQVKLNMYKNIARTQAISEFKSKEYDKYK